MLILLNSCYNECSDYEPMGAPSVKLQVYRLDDSKVDDSLLQVAYHGDTNNTKLLTDNKVAFQLDVPPAIKNKTAFEDSLSVYYNDSLQSKVKVTIAKTEGTCFDVYKLSRVVVNDSVYCTSNCTNKIYDVAF